MFGDTFSRAAAQLNISILQGYDTVDFFIVLLKFILVSCVHRYYIQNHAQHSIFCESEISAISWLNH